MQKIKTILPKGYSQDQENNRIYGPKGEEINCSISVERYYTTLKNGERDSYVDICYYFGKDPDIRIYKQTIKFQDLSNQSKIAKNRPGEIFCDLSDYKFTKLLSGIIKESIKGIEPEENIILNQGFNMFSDGVVFALGDKVINNFDGKNYVSESSFKVREHTKQKDYFKWLKRFYELGDIFPVLLLCAIIPYIEPIIKASGLQGAFDFSVYLFAESGMFKTEILKLLTGIFSGDENMVNLSSDKDTIVKLSQFTNTTVLIDDLNKTDSKRQTEKNEEKLSTILQSKSSGGNIKYKGNTAKITSMIFISAEYLLKNPSTINRCLIAEMNSIDMDVLTYLQENQGLYVEFIIDFIEWVCKNYKELIDKVKKYKEICKGNPVDEDLYIGSKRVMRTNLILSITLKLFSEFICGNSPMIHGEISFLEYFQLSIDMCISNTLDNIKNYNAIDNCEHVIKIIDTLSGQDNIELIAKSYDDYKKKQHNPKKYKFIFFKRDDFYCITGEDLLRVINDDDKYEKFFSRQEISQQLKEYGLLKNHQGKGCSTVNGCGTKKFYQIRISVVLALYKEKHFKEYGENLTEYDLHRRFPYSDDL